MVVLLGALLLRSFGGFPSSSLDTTAIDRYSTARLADERVPLALE